MNHFQSYIAYSNTALFEAFLCIFRADLSQKKMESMQEKYTHMQVKVETTKKTLNEAQDRIVRQDKIQETVKNLQERAQVYAEKMTQRQESSALFCAEIADFDFPQPLINYEEDDVKEGSIESTVSSSCSGKSNISNILYYNIILNRLDFCFIAEN